MVIFFWKFYFRFVKISRGQLNVLKNDIFWPKKSKFSSKMQFIPNIYLDICPTTTFVRPPHLSDLNIKCVICPTCHLSDPSFFQPIFEMTEQTLRGWEWGSGGETPQLGDESLPVRLGRSGKVFFYFFFLQKLKSSLTSKPCIRPLNVWYCFFIKCVMRLV
jgi:hypothetical protein